MRPASIAASLAALAVVLSLSPAPRAQESPILSAMRDEMARSMAELRMKGEPAPYYIEYEIDDISLDARHRAARRHRRRRRRITRRTLRVQVRVGDYAVRQLALRHPGSRRGRRRRQRRPCRSTTTTTPSAARSGWRPTRPTSAPSACSPRRRRRFRTARPRIRSRISRARRPSQTVLPVSTPAPIDRRWVDRAKQLSAVFAAHPDIESSEVWISETHGTSFYLNSEGFKVGHAGLELAYLRVTADARADDGMTVPDVFSRGREPARRFAADAGTAEARRRAGEPGEGAAHRRRSATSSPGRC